MKAKNESGMIEAVIIGVLALLLIGVVAATVLSRHALPGQFLYSYKQTVQGVELALDLSPQSKAASNVAFADTNVLEIQALLSQLSSNSNQLQHIQTSTTALVHHTQDAAQQIAQAGKTGKTVSTQANDLANTTQTAIPTLQQALLKAPASSKASLQTAITQLATAQQPALQYTTTTSSSSNTSNNPGAKCDSIVVTNNNGVTKKQETHVCNPTIIATGNPGAGTIHNPIPTPTKPIIPVAPPYTGPIGGYTGVVQIPNLTGVGGLLSQIPSSGSSVSSSSITSTASGGGNQQCSSSIYSNNNGVVTNLSSQDCNVSLSN
jgi:hypothetical protein